MLNRHVIDMNELDEGLSEMRQLERLEELPDWFDIDAYRATSRFTDVDWIIQSYLRQQQYDQEARLGQKNILICGIVNDWMPDFKQDNCYSPVRDIIVREISLMADSLKDHQPPDESLSQELINCYVPSVLSYGLCRIDLSATNPVILEGVGLWLDEIRQKQKYVTRTVYSASVFRRWTTSEALAYWDLTRWAHSCEVGIPQWLMGEALFPGSNQGNKADRVRQTTRKVADELLSKACLEGLISQYRAKNEEVPVLPDMLDLTTLNSKHILILE